MPIIVLDNRNNADNSGHCMLPELCPVLHQNPRRAPEPHPGRLRDGREAGDRGLARVRPGRFVCQIKLEKRSARLRMVIEPPLVRRLRIRGHSTFQADFIIKISSNVLRRHFEHGRI